MPFNIEILFGFYLFYLVGGLAILFTLLHMLYIRRSPSSMMVWLLLMIIAPYIFVVIYFLFGVRKHPFYKENHYLNSFENSAHTGSEHLIDTLLQKNGIAHASSNNSLNVYTNSTNAYNALKEAIKGAKKSIYIGTYVFKHDIVTKEILQILKQKSDEGVEVKLLIDSVGSFGAYLMQFKLNRLRSKNFKVSFFMPPIGTPFRYRFNLRYHRKIYLIDEQVLFSGSMNLAKEYMGPTQTSKNWIDLLYEAKGDICTHYVNIFLSDWANSMHQRPKRYKLFDREKKGDTKIQVVPSGPDVKGDPLLEAILNGIYNAKSRIWIVTPYFIPDEPILQALKVAHHKGVDVKLITPKRSNHKIADLTRSSYIRQLQEVGCQTVLFEGPMLHAKAILFDSDVVMLGSVNLDYRSLFLNYEVSTISYSKETIDTLQEWMGDLLSNPNSNLAPAGKTKRIFENFMRIFASQL